MARTLIGGLGVTALLGLQGCGFLISDGPPPGHQNMNYFSCTESDVGPAFDFVWAALNIAGAVIAASDETIQDRDQTIAIGAAWGMFSTASGLVGTSKSSDCREAKAQLADRLNRALPPVAAGAGQGPMPSGWRQIRQWAGTGNLTTESFPVSSSQWRVRWSVSNPGAGAQLFVTVVDGTGREMTKGAVQRGAGNGQLYVTANPGNYYIEITAVDLDWDVAVEESSQGRP
jgi:hypothetical protein